MKLIYVAGPYRGEGDNAVFLNILEARSCARLLWLKGWAVFCPHGNTIFMDGPDIPAQTFLDGDLEILRRCDAIFLTPRWELSKGARGERDFALATGTPVYYRLEDVPDGRA
jgi:hypothetical protein